MTNKIALIAPYQELKEISDRVKNQSGFNYKSELGDLKEGVKVAQRLSKEGVEVIISRGGTYKQIKETVNLSVIEIKVTGYDLLRVLYKYRKYPGKIGVVGYSNVVSGAKSISSILKLKTSYYYIEKDEEVEDKIEKAKKEGIQLIIGDTIGVNTAKKFGLDYELVKSGEEAVELAIREAKEVYELTVEERERKKRLEAILDSAQEGIIAVDKNEKINVFNPMAEKIFKTNRHEALGEKINEIVFNTRIPRVMELREKELGKLLKTGDSHIAVNRVPIIINDQVRGAVATFQDVTKLQNMEQKIRKTLSEKGLIAKHTLGDIIGNSEIIKQAIDLAQKYAKSDSTVLITGDSGTGKELFAQGIHNTSERKNGPFVAINCAALPPNLLESELFGYVEGAFTGARKGGKQGVFELAHNGTLFLDEIGEMDKRLQARILRVLEQREVMRIGDDKIIPVNVRVIGATNLNLKKIVADGDFRKDLFYRLNILNLTIPPLKERKEDIKYYVEYFLKKYRDEFSSTINQIELDIISRLQAYHWPGNVRELRNFIEKISVIAKDKEFISTEDISYVLEDLFTDEDVDIQDKNVVDKSSLLSGDLRQIEKNVVRQVLAEENYNKSRAAQRLGIDRNTLRKKLDE